QEKDMVRVDDALAVGLDVREVLGGRSHRQDHILGAQLPRLIARDLDDSLAGQLPEAEDALDFVLLEEEFDALGVLVDDRLLAALPDLEVELDAADVDAELLGPTDLFVDLGVLEKRLGRDAAAMRACAPDERILLDDGDFHSELAGADAGDIAARAAADDD